MTKSKAVECAKCGVEGERGEHPGEGKLVHGGGESALKPHQNDLLCDDCADELMRRPRPGREALKPGVPTKMLTTRVSQDLDIELYELARLWGISRSAAIRRALREVTLERVMGKRRREAIDQAREECGGVE